MSVEIGVNRIHGIASQRGFIPDRAFWENDLEIGHDAALGRAGQDGFWDEWIQKRTGRQIEMICTALGLSGNGRVRERKDDLRMRTDELQPLLLVEEFARFKSKLATATFASKVLPADIVEACAKGEGDWDTQALCYAIYHANPYQLRGVLHLDRIHKSGFARMRLKGNPRRPQRALGDFLQPATIERILREFDDSKGDGRSSEFKNIMQEEQSHLVFIRRCEKPSSILQGQQIVHGYRPEWIVLVFADAAKRVSIASLSVTDSLEIANRIASGFYEFECDYENDSEITYAAQLRRLLAVLKQDQDAELAIVELVCSNSPLEGACPIRLSNEQSIGPAILDFERKVGSITTSLDAIESIKVAYKKKRVSLLLEKVDGADDQYVVRYSDQRLNPLERVAFEDYLRKTHAIPVLSTEKRFKAAT